MERQRYPSALLAAVLFLFSSSFSWSHDHPVTEAIPSHLDAYVDTDGSAGEGSYNLQCLALNDNLQAFPGNGAAIVQQSNAPHIDFNSLSNGQNSKTAVMFQISNQLWTGTATASISTLNFEILRTVLKPGNPPTLAKETVRTFSYPNLNIPSTVAPVNYCMTWDGSFAVDELGFGKVNGTYEAKAKIKFIGSDLNLEADLAYPGSAFTDEDGPIIFPYPILIDVMDIHSIISSPTVIGAIPGLPINMSYKLSKSALVTIDVYRGSNGNCVGGLDLDEGTGNNSSSFHPVNRASTNNCNTSWLSGGRFVRRIVNNQPRWGENTTQGKLGNSEIWDGRDENGNLVSTGTYVIGIFSWDPDGISGIEGGVHGHDIDVETFTVAVDPLQIADLTVQGLSTVSTGFAGIAFTMTEAATAYFSIWQSSAAFDVNLAPPHQTCSAPFSGCSPADVYPLNGAGKRIRRIVNTFPAKQNVSMVWDGRDEQGNPVDDGNYVFTLWAAENENLPVTDLRVIKTVKPRIGIIPVTRGLVPLSQVTPQSAAFSSPPVSGVAPFFFGYALGRDAIINLRVLATNGQAIAKGFNTSNALNSLGFSGRNCSSSAGCPVAHLVQNQIRQGGITHADPLVGWDGRTIGLPSFNGIRIGSGSYLVELTAQDTLFPNRISTITTQFTMNMLRTANVTSSPLLTGSTDSATISYIISEPMEVRWDIYNPSTVFNGAWPNLTVQTGELVRSIFGARPARIRVTEFWDGRNDAGFFVPDGNYLSVLKASDTYGHASVDPVIRELAVARGQISILSPSVTPTFPTLENSSATLNIPLEPFEISYTLSRDALVSVEVFTLDRQLVKRLVQQETRTGLLLNKDFWDGTNFAEIRLTTGSFTIDIIAEDLTSVSASTSVARLPLSLDLLRVYDVALTPLTPEVEAAEISYQLSEPMEIDLRIYKPGTVFNVLGTPIPPESESLVFKIIGPRPSRVALTETWPGINLFQKQVQDGNYKFRLTADDDQGNVITNVEVGDLPVLRAGFLDPQATFDDQTFAYPNPVTNTPVKICTLLPIDADVGVKIYTLSGELVWEKNLGRILGGKGPCNGTPAIEWNLDNSWGRRVAPGVYFYVLRADSHGGTRQFIQTRKKILVP